jgi:hypothetical protein
MIWEGKENKKKEKKKEKKSLITYNNVKPVYLKIVSRNFIF